MGDLRKQIEQWNDHDEFPRCVEAIEAIPENARGYKLTVLLGRAYSNLAVLGDHSANADDDEIDQEMLSHAIELLCSICGSILASRRASKRCNRHSMPRDAKGGV